jgi:hypothetical protein
MRVYSTGISLNPMNSKWPVIVSLSVSISLPPSFRAMAIKEGVTATCRFHLLTVEFHTLRGFERTLLAATASMGSV